MNLKCNEATRITTTYQQIIECLKEVCLLFSLSLLLLFKYCSWQLTQAIYIFCFRIILRETWTEISLHDNLTLPKSTEKCQLVRDQNSHLRDSARQFGKVRLSWKNSYIFWLINFPLTVPRNNSSGQTCSKISKKPSRHRKTSSES